MARGPIRDIHEVGQSTAIFKSRRKRTKPGSSAVPQDE
jgi:hypothetical protein